MKLVIEMEVARYSYKSIFGELRNALSHAARTYLHVVEGDNGTLDDVHGDVIGTWRIEP